MTYSDIDGAIDAYNRDARELEATVAALVARRDRIVDAARGRVILKYLRPRLARISIDVTPPADGWPGDAGVDARAQETDDLLTIPGPLKRCHDAAP